ncbi:AraC family transcriptional regulator, partial [Bifidobacterium amazonense]
VYHLADDPSHERSLRVSPSSCVLLPPNITVWGTGRTGENVDFLWIHFLADWKPRETAVPAQQTSSAVPVQPDTLQRIRRKEYCPEVDGICIIPERFAIYNMKRVLVTARMVLSCANVYRYTQRENDLLTAALLIELSDDYLSSLARTKTDSAKTAPVIEWIRTNMSAKLTVADVADHFVMNPDYLNRLFKREHGTTMRDYLIDLRIETAKALLIHTKLPIGTVAKYAYFNDKRNFMKQFKKRTSLTPTDFRTALAHTYGNTPFVDPALPVPHDVGVIMKHGEQDEP